MCALGLDHPGFGLVEPPPQGEPLVDGVEDVERVAVAVEERESSELRGKQSSIGGGRVVGRPALAGEMEDQVVSGWAQALRLQGIV